MTTQLNDQISRAAKMAGDWWADKLHPAHAEKREAFGRAVARHVEAGLRGTVQFTFDGMKPGNGEPRAYLATACDYDPQGPILEAVRDVIDPACPGFMFSARGILPSKHALGVTPTVLSPKPGYGNFQPDIEVPRT